MSTINRNKRNGDTHYYSRSTPNTLLTMAPLGTAVNRAIG